MFRRNSGSRNPTGYGIPTEVVITVFTTDERDLGTARPGTVEKLAEHSDSVSKFVPRDKPEKKT